MTTLSKMDMIKELIKAGTVNEMKKDKEDTLKFASRLYKSLPSEKVKALYAQLEVQPEKAVDEVAKKISKGMKKIKSKAQVEEIAVPVELPKVKTKKEKVAKAEPEKKATKVEVEKAPKVEVPEKPVDKRFLPEKDAKGNLYKKSFMIETLAAYKFGALKKGIRTLKGKKYDLVYSLERNIITAYDRPTEGEPKIVGKTICPCQFITEAFIKKYSK